MIVRMDWFDSFMIGALSAVSPGKQRWTQPFWGAPTYGWSSHRPYIISNSDDHRNTLSGENAVSYPHTLMSSCFHIHMWMILTRQPQMVLIIAATSCLHKSLLPPYHPPHIILITSYLLELVNVDQEGIFGCGPVVLCPVSESQLVEQTKRSSGQLSCTGVSSWTGQNYVLCATYHLCIHLFLDS